MSQDQSSREWLRDRVAGSVSSEAVQSGEPEVAAPYVMLAAMMYVQMLRKPALYRQEYGGSSHDR
jgi:hypothetical protein